MKSRYRYDPKPIPEVGEQQPSRKVDVVVGRDSADAAIVERVTRVFQAKTRIPKEWKHLIQQVCSANIHAIALACGSLELAYRRTLDHAEELRELDNWREM